MYAAGYTLRMYPARSVYSVPVLPGCTAGDDFWSLEIRYSWAYSAP